ncbi:DNA polymerase delta small subunit Cdc1 [Coemansia spiralis]|uniref:DNA polymerase delta small subunit Cdc1 n=1 Tax=Coemansia spiralis TaxID=417178 RepID=A0A9W8GEJ9_9FUNG|nr:DNA polymerase delta small subunit Cdc1 [Coemansia spiralis]
MLAACDFGTSSMEHMFERATAVSDDPAKYSRVFSTGRRSYVRQFNELYYARLNELKPHVLRHAEKRWSGKGIKHTPKALNVEAGETTYIVGTVFIDSSKKPSTLEQVEKEHWISDPEISEGYRNGAETVFLEDESGRIVLVGDAVNKSLLVSGIVAAMLGKETPDGSFEVVDMCFAGMAPQIALPDVTEDKYVAFVSGLSASVECPVTLEMQMLAEYLCGTLGAASAQQPLPAQIVQVVVAGNILSLPTPPLGHTEDARANDRSATSALVSAIDSYLADIAAVVPLALMPGAQDPADTSLPQQPIHRSMFAQCKQYSGFRSLSNPAFLEVDGHVLLGSSGQNVDDIGRYVRLPNNGSGDSPCELAARSLQWRHIAPSAPDTLWCYPFSDRDPFILAQSPHVYFIGGQDLFDSGEALGADGQHTTVVTVPKFAQTHSIVLLNLRNMKCATARFSATGF